MQNEAKIKADAASRAAREDKESFGNAHLEHFFPMQNAYEQPPLNLKKKLMKNNTQEEIYENVNYDDECLQNYVPMFESVGDVCSPTATFKNELNAQGLNYPEGYNHSVNGSLLN
jgi:hypothetical protein